ncbi:MAG: DNA alkylation repair protein [Planctomycetota bacterium]
MNLKQTLAALKKAGTPQNVKVYRRHGAQGELFGVSFAELKKLKKQIGVDHALAEELWATGNADAMSLATMVADPAELTKSAADRWLRGVDYYMVGDLFAGLVARSPVGLSRYEKWSGSKREYPRQVGYAVLASLLVNDADGVADAVCKEALGTIEAEIHGSQNRARHAMNNALISIGSFKPDLAVAAVETAGRIGPLEVDHGETGCKTPDAAAYIEKTLASRADGAPRRRKRC